MDFMGSLFVAEISLKDFSWSAKLGILQKSTFLYWPGHGPVLKVLGSTSVLRIGSVYKQHPIKGHIISYSSLQLFYRILPEN